MFELQQGFTALPIPEKTREFMKGKTFHPNTKITYDDLSYLNVKYYDFSHNVQSGEIIVAKKLEKEVLEIFLELFENEYEIEKIRLADYYDGNDDLCMADNNSSAFNYRVVDSTDSISMHGYGRAIDINPKINPYIVGEKVMPANGVQYCDRKLAFAHKIDHDDICYKVFVSHGWKWGGDWTRTKDYQHFYKEFKKPLKTALRKVKNLFSK